MNNLTTPRKKLLKTWKSCRRPYCKKQTWWIRRSRLWKYVFIKGVGKQLQNKIDSAPSERRCENSDGYLVTEQTFIYHSKFFESRRMVQFSFRQRCLNNRYRTTTGEGILYVYEKHSYKLRTVATNKDSEKTEIISNITNTYSTET